MKAFLAIACIIAGTMVAAGQDRWTVVHNGKTRLEAKNESAKNSFFVKREELQQKGTLSIFIKDKSPRKDWVRTILVVDEAENEIANGNGDLMKVSNKQLFKAAASARKIHIYSISLPSDPEKAALVRVRRIHLATIQFK